MSLSTMPLGTPLTNGAQRLLLLGSGELGRGGGPRSHAPRPGSNCRGCATTNAPAMQVAHRCLHHRHARRGANTEAPGSPEKAQALIVPEVEAIATKTLMDLEAGRVERDSDGASHPTHHEPRGHSATGGRGVWGLKTSPYRFAGNVRRSTVTPPSQPGGPALRGKAHHEFLRQGPEPGAASPGQIHAGLGTTPGMPAVAVNAQRVIVEGFVSPLTPRLRC
jgi:hypothetical protein